jgi:hypothetical protein
MNALTPGWPSKSFCGTHDTTFRLGRFAAFRSSASLLCSPSVSFQMNRASGTAAIARKTVRLDAIGALSVTPKEMKTAPSGPAPATQASRTAGSGLAGVGSSGPTYLVTGPVGRGGSVTKLELTSSSRGYWP